MKKTISFILFFAIVLNAFTVPSIAADEVYGTLNVEYANKKGQTETLNVMVNDNYVLVDAFQLGESLGYKVNLTKNNDGVVIYNTEDQTKPRLHAVFYFESTKVEYLLFSHILEYEAPVNSIYNNNGAWIPLKYAVFALNSSLLIVDEVVTITMPQNTLLHTMFNVAEDMYEIQFDYYSDMNFSDGNMAVQTGTSRIINLFSGILKFEGESWLLLFQQFWGDTSAYDNKFGDELTTLFCTNSDKELKALNEEINLLKDVFSTDGKLGTAMQEIKLDLDSNVGDLYNQCEELFKNIDKNNANVSKYNATYEQLENALNKQTIFGNSGQLILDVQNGLDSVTKTVSVLGEILEVCGYMSEFEEKDDFSVQALINYLNEFSDETILPDSLHSTLKINADALNSNILDYSVYKYIENNYMDWLQAGLQIGQQMGAQANLLLLAWNIAAATVPFIKNGLDSADFFELSMYAYALQQDSFINYTSFRENIFANESSLTATNFYKTAQYLYTYLKSAYMARDAAVGSFAGHKDNPEAQPVISSWDKPNELIAKYLSEIKMLSADNKDGSLGFLPDRSNWLVINYNDNDLLKLLGYNVDLSNDFENKDVPKRETSDERDIVLVLDVSGSMSGTPLEETKKAATKFINTILKEDASIGIVTYDNTAAMMSDFSVDETHLTGIASEIRGGGGTNIESGLQLADGMLSTSNAEKKIIVLMSDGAPNAGKVDDELVEYAGSIKEKGTYIYTLGFFSSMGSGKHSAQTLMQNIASDGCHYEVADADDLVFFFGDIADQINGQKFIYVRIACPVDVTVTYLGESLSSSEKDFNDRTSFGALSLEDIEDSDDKIKTLRLKEGKDYSVKIKGTGRGKMDYTIGYMDDSGEYSDMRNFRNIDITRSTVIDTSTKYSDKTILNVDEDGDGKYDLKFRAGANEYGELVDYTYIVYIVSGIVGAVAILAVILVIRKKSKNRKVAQ